MSKKAFDKYRSQVFIGDRVVCIWTVKNQYGIDVLQHGTEWAQKKILESASEGFEEYFNKLFLNVVLENEDKFLSFKYEELETSRAS